MARVLHISKYYYPFSGGTEQIARDIVVALKDVPGCEQLMLREDLITVDFRILRKKAEGCR